MLWMALNQKIITQDKGIHSDLGDPGLTCVQEGGMSPPVSRNPSGVSVRTEPPGGPTPPRNKRKRVHLTLDTRVRLDAYKRYLMIKRANGDFQRESPFAIAKSIYEAVGRVKEVQKVRGELLVEVYSAKQSTLLQQLKILSGSDIIVYPHHSLNFSRGVVFCRDLLNCTIEEIVSEMAPQQVVAAKRIKWRREGKLVDSPLLELTFDTPNLPGCVEIGIYQRVQVRPFVPAPMRCYRCQRYGHTASRCKRAQICHCGRPTHDGSRCVEPFKCVNCSGVHTARSQNCPLYKQEVAVQELRAREKLSYPEAKRRLLGTGSGGATVSYARVAATARPAALATADIESIVSRVIQQHLGSLKAQTTPVSAAGSKRSTKHKQVGLKTLVPTPSGPIIRVKKADKRKREGSKSPVVSPTTERPHRIKQKVSSAPPTAGGTENKTEAMETDRPISPAVSDVSEILVKPFCLPKVPMPVVPVVPVRFREMGWLLSVDKIPEEIPLEKQYHRICRIYKKILQEKDPRGTYLKSEAQIEKMSYPAFERLIDRTSAMVKTHLGITDEMIMSLPREKLGNQKPSDPIVTNLPSTSDGGTVSTRSKSKVLQITELPTLDKLMWLRDIDELDQSVSLDTQFTMIHRMFVGILRECDPSGDWETSIPRYEALHGQDKPIIVDTAKSLLLKHYGLTKASLAIAISKSRDGQEDSD